MVTWEELDKLLETDLHKDEVIPQEEPRPDIASDEPQLAHQPQAEGS